jgi:hypothetical protein
MLYYNSILHHIVSNLNASYYSSKRMNQLMVFLVLTTSDRIHDVHCALFYVYALAASAALFQADLEQGFSIRLAIVGGDCYCYYYGVQPTCRAVVD